MYQLKTIPLIIIGLFVFASQNAKAQGDLLIYPKRIVFEGPARTQQISLSNTGKETARYVISVIQMRMNENGSFDIIKVSDSAQRFADKNFRVFPRSVVLQPNSAQVIKIQLVNTGELQTGEYRSHLYFRAEEQKNTLGADKAKDSSMSVNIKPIFGISVPVIIRDGESTTELSISTPSIMFDKDSMPYVSMFLNRTGNMSVFGDISINHTSITGEISTVAIAKGIAVYSPNNKRHIKMMLDKNINVDYLSGSLQIIFADHY